MKLGNYLNVTELSRLIAEGYILRRDHPTLPLAILNYSNKCQFEGFWPDVVKKCRGLILDCVHDHPVCDDCTIVSRPFHKFFNLNQSDQPETHEANLPSVVPTVTEKMDGWFGILWKCVYADNKNGDTHYGVASRGSFDSPGALFATQKIQKLVKYGAIDEFPQGWTPIFEIIFKEGRIVVDYPFEGLVLLGLVNNETGEEMPYESLQLIWAKIAGYAAGNPWIRLVKAHNMTPQEAQFSEKRNFEGFVLSYGRPGTFPLKVKVKLEDYKRLHKLITGVTPQILWKKLHDPLFEWTDSPTTEGFRVWVIEHSDKLYTQFEARLRAAHKVINNSFNEFLDIDIKDRSTKKRIAKLLFDNNTEDSDAIMYLLEGKVSEGYQAIWNKLRPHGREIDSFYKEGQGE